MTNDVSKKDQTELPARETAVLKAENLSKIYEDGTRALSNVNLAVKSGEIYTLLGGNGAGKTTMMNLFLNFIEPTEGSAKIQGYESHKEPLKAKNHVAFVSEDVKLYPTFTALQNVDFFCKISGKEDYTESDYRQTLLRVGLQDEAHHKKLSAFSKGMRQKTGIAIAILKEAPAILLDEPTSGLDPKAGFEFCKLLRQLRDDGTAVFMSTHDIFRARELADTIGILNGGRLVMEKAIGELEDENLQELYVKYMAGYMDANEGEEV